MLPHGSSERECLDAICWDVCVSADLAGKDSHSLFVCELSSLGRDISIGDAAANLSTGPLELLQALLGLLLCGSHL